MLHMDTVGIRELRQNASNVVARVKAGESVEISDRGRPVARMVPLAPTRYSTLLDQGRVRERKTSVADLPAAREVVGLSAALAAQRDEERY